jgi:L-alanine-DL-glutamate epimerase-like enolase superfamily enzyme
VKAVVRTESWPIRGGFRIARGARATADIVVVELYDGDRVGRGECVPYARYGESVSSVRRAIATCADRLDAPDLRAAIAELPPGAARNALDCALWDLEAKREGDPVWMLAGLDAAPREVVTMRTISVAAVEEMRAAATALRSAHSIKIKVDGGNDLERISAVHQAAPEARLVVDANESWSVEQTRDWLPRLGALGVCLVEQPLRADDDEALAQWEHELPICADEAFHDRASFARAARLYDAINIKLDKAGGLTEALACAREAHRRGLPFMVGCMVSTSLAVEPALLLAPTASFIDLDGPLLLERDREGARHDAARGVLRPSSAIWGAA